jgi:hypothetical protein
MACWVRDKTSQGPSQGESWFYPAIKLDVSESEHWAARWAEIQKQGNQMCLDIPEHLEGVQNGTLFPI